MSEFGDAVMAVVSEGFRVDKADPLIKISDELVEEWRKCPQGYELSVASVHDDLLYIRAVNGEVTYRIGEHMPQEHVYVAERVSCTIDFP